jgi:23S rRNA pseudouridine955/2504/2580 synthase
MDDSPQGGTQGVRFAEVRSEDSGQRLDNYLLRELKGVPRTRLYRAIRKGEVRVNKGRVQADYRLVAGDLVRIPPLRRPEPGQPAQMPKGLARELESRVVYEDEQLLVLDKPSGLAVHGGSGLSYGLIECLRQMRPTARFMELIHRLDRDTSGLVLIALKRSALRELHRQLREKHVDKRYLALAVGHWPTACRQVEAPLEKNVLLSGERVVKVSKEGKRALTRFEVRERFDKATLIEARPVTGRTHQIRVHALHAGHPLLGDDKYSSQKGEELARELGLKRLFLHASELRFELQGSGKLSLQAPLDHSLEKTLKKLRNTMK